MDRVTSFLGLFVIMGLAWLMRSGKGRIPWRIVLGGLALQFAFALLFLSSTAVIEAINDVFLAIVGCVKEGTRFVFGAELMDQEFAHSSFFLQALPTIVFFSALMSLLYYFGVMQWLVRGLAWLMRKTLGTSAAETLSAAANVFVGQTEAPLVVRPYLTDMTRSELMTVMVGGFATVAGGVLAAYVAMGINAGHLLTASVISAPAALLLAKIMQPETQRPRTLSPESAEVKPDNPPVNAIHAVAIGAADGAKLAINVAAMLIAFLGLIALVNLLLGWLAGLAGYEEGAWSLETLLGYVFWPLAWIMGVETADCLIAGRLLGIKVVANEFLAYERLADMEDGALSERSYILLTYALCGFANFGSIGIQIGGIGPLAPTRRGDLARLGFRAMLGGVLAACMTACVVGVLL